MSNPAQGAVGAETMTAGANDLREKVARLVNPTCFNARPEAYGIPSEDDPRWKQTLIYGGRLYAYERADEIIALFAAPAQPAGAVPDSLIRASFEATSGLWRAEPAVDEHGRQTGQWWLIMADQPMGYEFDRWEDARLAADAVNYVRTLLSSHPAGQDAGCDWCLSLTGKRDPHRSCAKCAPDSTRTGQGEARLIGPTMTPEQDERIAHNLCGEFGPDAVIANASFVKAFYAELYAAARPAAPEAQGAWRPISTAPRNDTLVMLGWWCDVGGDPRWIAVAGWYEAGPADRCWYAAYDEERVEPTHWQPLDRLPAPPASSGQEA